MLKAEPLLLGDTVRLISPSSGLANLVPHRVERVRKELSRLGFKVDIGEHALKSEGYVSASAENRVADLHAAFEDPNVKMIMSFIGGNHANQLLPLIDFELIKNNPKILIGYSDITVLHIALYTKAKLVSFYGPAALTQFGENPRVLPYTWDYLQKAIMSPNPIGAIQPSEQWTDEILDWFKQEDTTRPRDMEENSGYQWIKEGKVTGALIGGCLSSLLHLRGTEYWPNLESSILFLETSESSANFKIGQSIEDIDADLTDLQNSGVFNQISGLVFGRTFGHNDKEREAINLLLKKKLAGFNFPVLTNVNIGHTDPVITVPIGVKATVDSELGIFSIDESGVIDTELVRNYI